MAVPTKYVLYQGPVLQALGRAASSGLRARLGSAPAPQEAPSTPGPAVQTVVPPRPQELVRDYVRHVGGDPSGYKGRVPPHLFPQWVFPLIPSTFEGTPYPLHRGLNGGCRMEINGPLPIDESLHVRAWLDSIDDNGRRAVLCQKAVTGTESQPDALTTYFYVIVPGGKGDKSNGAKSNGGGEAPKATSKSKEKPRVPHDVRELAYWRIPANAGLEFAKLTGDFNPVHWIPPYARAFGFKHTILHGFGTMARAYEGLTTGLFAGDTNAIRVFDAQFTRPLVLPARVGLYVSTPAGSPSKAYVGDAPGGPAYLSASFEQAAERTSSKKKTKR